MPPRIVNLQSVPAFDYQFGPLQAGRMQDVGRNVGSDKIGLVIQTVAPGKRASRRHRHLFQEELLIVMAGNGQLLHGDERIPVAAGACVCYRAGDTDAHTFENSGDQDLVIWAFGNRFTHEVALYPDEGVAFVEGLGAEVPLASVTPSAWTEEDRRIR
ncbi:MAG TPA: cupin domain-containing protein [Burkholderiaceae bacterium]|nr:cupin domain-containing protein [Burkholderiaceae bacterium]